MTARLLSFALILTFATNSPLKAQTVTIPDPQFVSWLTVTYPACISGNQLDTTCSAIQNATLVDCSNQSIQNLDGIQYFTSLDTLVCLNGILDNIPSIPITVTYLKVGNNQLASLPMLPSGLKYLIADNNNFVTLPALPDSMISLQIFGNELTSLPAIPASLVGLDCAMNQLTALPALPNSLSLLSVSVNPLGSLPSPLPTGLGTLYCGNCQLSQLPMLPPNLYNLVATNNQLTSLPPFPPTLGFVNISINPSLTCLPAVTAFMTYLNIESTAITCVPNIVQHAGSWPEIDTLPLCGLYSSGCQVAWNVTGYTYLDANNNCIDESESRLHNLKAMLYHGGTLVGQVYTNTTGAYSFDTDLSGGYSVSIDTSIVPFHVLCPSNNSYNADITAIDSFDTDANFGLTCDAGYDIGIHAIINTAGTFFPNDTSTVSIYDGDMAGYYGATCNTAGVSGTVQVTFSGPVAYAGSIGLATPTTVSGNTITWNIADFSLVEFYEAFRVRFLTDTAATIGQAVCINVTVTPNDANVSNNLVQHCFPIVNSFDPNVKEASPIETATPGGWISYTVHFQNTGNAPAHNILVTDQLDTNLDWSTFQLNGTSHEAVTQVLEDGLVKFTFLNIMLPDSTSNEPQSHGWIQYRVKAKDNLALNTTIDNSASIYFDYNPPVITNTTHNTYFETAVNGAPTKPFVFSMFPNPAASFTTLEYEALTDKASVILSDVSGRIVIAQTAPSNGRVNLSVAGLANGVYRVQLMQGPQMLVSRKLIVIR